MSLVSVKGKPRGDIVHYPLTEIDQSLLARATWTLTCMVEDLLAFELEENEHREGDHEDRQQNPPQPLV